MPHPLGYRCDPHISSDLVNCIPCYLCQALFWAAQGVALPTGIRIPAGKTGCAGGGAVPWGCSGQPLQGGDPEQGPEGSGDVAQVMPSRGTSMCEGPEAEQASPRRDQEEAGVA